MAEVQLAGVCVRAREWACQQLDGELSDFEGVLLEAHVARCVGCREFSRGIAAITDHVRETSPETPAVLFTLPPRRRLLRNDALIAAVAVVAVSTTGFATVFTLGDLSHGLPATTPEAISSQPPADSEQDLAALRALRVSQLRPSAIRAAIEPARGLQLR